MFSHRWIVGFIAVILSTDAYPCQRVDPVASVDMVKQADVIVRVMAVEYAVPPGTPNMRTTGEPDSAIRFKVLEVIRGVMQPELILPGYLVDHDDFNDHEPPYNGVRPNGREGSCFANSYRLGAKASRPVAADDRSAAIRLLCCDSSETLESLSNLAQNSGRLAAPCPS
jgi:hypothetical protein